MRSRLEVARVAAALGWLVHPCKQDKTPYTRWKDEATSDVEQVQAWWAQWPDALVGLRTGDGVAVIDIDRAEALTLGLERYGELPGQPVPTRRGQHYYCRIDRAEDLRSVAGVGGIVGLDSRATGGYVIFYGDNPPLRATLPALPAQWVQALRRVELAPAPAPALPQPTTSSADALRRLDELLLLLRQPQPSERHATCLRVARLAGGWAGAGALDETATLSALLEAVSAHDDYADSARAVRDGYRHGLRAPCLPEPIPQHVEPPQIVEADDEQHPLDSAPSYLADGTGLGNAGLLVHLARDNYRYINEGEQWAFWEAERGRWLTSPYAANAVHHLASQVATWHRSLVEQDPENKAAIRTYRHAASGNGISEMVRLAASGAYPDIPVSREDLDQIPGVVNCAGQTIRLLREYPYVQVEPAKKDDLLTRATAAGWDVDATCPRWDRFVREIMDDNGDHAWFLQRLLGYALSGYCTEQRFFVLQGDGGNGKGAMQRAITATVGDDYVATARADTFLVKQFSEIPADAASLVGARFVFPEELPQNRKLDSTVLKAMSGKDRIKARLLHQNLFTYTPQFTLFFSANPGYEIDATDAAMQRRFVLVPFLRSFRDNPDKTLDDTLARERDGILQWLLAGWVGYAREGLQPPAAWAEAADEVRASNDAIGTFIEEKTQDTGQRLISNEEIYQTYRAWATEAGEEPVSQRRFSAGLKARGYTQRVTGGRRCWVGLYAKQTGQGAKNRD